MDLPEVAPVPERKRSGERRGVGAYYVAAFLVGANTGQLPNRCKVQDGQSCSINPGSTIDPHLSYSAISSRHLFAGSSGRRRPRSGNGEAAAKKPRRGGLAAAIQVPT